jgi:hypothetical protein
MLPVCSYERHADDAWAAWGENWAVDVPILEVGGKGDGGDVSSEALYALQPGDTMLGGDSWIGSAGITMDGREVFRMNGRFCATNTIMFCAVSYFQKDHEESARYVIEGVAHRPTR